jgi:hypothetical protein
MQFVKTTEHGVVWRGLIASYPSLVPKEHVRAARLSLRRLSLFRMEWGSKALEFAVYQNQKGAHLFCVLLHPSGECKWLTVMATLSFDGAQMLNKLGV